jgi:hypothetical protein
MVQQMYPVMDAQNVQPGITSTRGAPAPFRGRGIPPGGPGRGGRGFAPRGRGRGEFTETKVQGIPLFIFNLRFLTHDVL